MYDQLLKDGWLPLFRDRFDVGTASAGAACAGWQRSVGAGTLQRSTTDTDWAELGGALKVATSTVASETSEHHKRHARIPRARRYALGGRWASQDENPASFGFQVGFRDGTNYYRARLLHTYGTDVWQYDAGEAGGQSLVTLQTRDPSEAAGRWHTFLLSIVADPAVAATTWKHDTVRLDENEYGDVVGPKLLRRSADATIPNLLDFVIETTNLGGTPVAGVVVFDELYGLYNLG